ncbi:uncharacterized protein LOC123228557 [Mangifera indica]|uniref:uncharacterized protein LOC123228557 n=1 Tax=Mangifera indica TaxID=29780 RepID=UPI001CF9B397|nr:uncharacterized protein LOC123228557 [Mangifera indica]
MASHPSLLSANLVDDLSLQRLVAKAVADRTSVTLKLRENKNRGVGSLMSWMLRESAGLQGRRVICMRAQLSSSQYVCYSYYFHFLERVDSFALIIWGCNMQENVRCIFIFWSKGKHIFKGDMLSDIKL